MITIDSVYIHAFGKLSRYERSFSSGFNMIYGDNEYGKTTLMCFLKMTFYGTDKSAKSKAEREHYRPWSGDTMAGRVDFTEGRISYRLEREFAATNSRDKIFLENTVTGERRSIPPGEALGERFFGCSLDCFEQSIFISRLGDSASGSPALGEINAKLSNLAATGDENVSFQTVEDRLLRAKYALMSKSRSVGIYDKAAAQLAVLNNRLMSARAQYDERVESEQRLAGLRMQLQSTGEEIDRLTLLEEQLKKHERAQRLREIISAADSLKTAEALIRCGDGSRMTYDSVEKYRSMKLKLANIDTRIEKLKSGLANAGMPDGTSRETDTPEISDITKRILELNSQKQKAASEIEADELRLHKIPDGIRGKGSAVPVMLIVIAAVLAVCSAAGFLRFGTVFGIIFCVLCAACATAAVIGFIRHGKSTATAREAYSLARESLIEKKSLEQRLSAQIADLQQQKLALSELLRDEQAKRLISQRLLEEKQNELDSLLEERSGLTAEINAFSNFLPDTSGEHGERADILSERLRRRDEVASRLDYTRRSAGGCSDADVTRELADIGTVPDEIADVETPGNDIKRETEKQQRLQEQIYALQSEIKLKFNDLAIPAELEREIKTIEKAMAEQKAFCDSADIALEALKDAFSELRSGYGGLLDSKTLEIFSGITGGKYSDVRVSNELRIVVEEQNAFGTKELETLSSGTQDQAYFSLRLALSELMFDRAEALPVFMDDVFSQYDDARAEKAFEYLQQYSKKRQVLFFTCHKHFADMSASVRQ